MLDIDIEQREARVLDRESNRLSSAEGRRVDAFGFTEPDTLLTQANQLMGNVDRLLAAEREENARLTAEVERLEIERDEWKAKHKHAFPDKLPDDRRAMVVCPTPSQAEAWMNAAVDLHDKYPVEEAITRAFKRVASDEAFRRKCGDALTSSHHAGLLRIAELDWPAELARYSEDGTELSEYISRLARCRHQMDANAVVADWESGE